ncbi:MAG: hypothetical protein Q4E32_02635 [Bacteroidales bacterium]|nr:hypothetical protein [Bacteroidales bacterium]
MKHLLLMMGACFAIALHAQNDEWRNHVTDTRWMLQNDGFYDQIMSGMKRMPNYNISVPVSGVRVSSGSNGEAYTTRHRSSSNSSRSRTTRVSPSAVNARLQADREYRQAQARARAEEERRRKKLEDDRRELQARLWHAQATSRMYRDAAAHDHWHATEGARLLSEVKATDFIELPQRKETSGADLAAGIKPKSKDKLQAAPVITEAEIKAGKPKGNNAASQDQAADLSTINEGQLQNYINAFDEPALLSLPEGRASKKKNGINVLILVDHRELALDSLDIFTLPAYGPVAVWGDSLMVLQDEHFGMISWTNGEVYSYVVPCGNVLVGKRGTSLYVVSESESSLLMDFGTNEFSLFPSDDHSVLCVFRDEDASTITKVDVEQRTKNDLVSLPLNVWSVTSNGVAVFALIENTVFLMDENGSPTKLYEDEERINDIVCSSLGLNIATDSRVIRFKSANDCDVIYDKGAKRLWFDGMYVYAQNEENDLIKFNEK